MKLEILASDPVALIDNDRDAITFAGNQLLDKGYIKPEYITACLHREESFPTGLLMANGEGIAIPHADYNLVHTDSISIVRLAKPVIFKQMEDADLTVACNIVFNLALSTSDQHLTILRRLFTLLQDDVFIKNCRTLAQSEINSYVTSQLTAK